MNNYEIKFVDYIATPTEKSCLGIATILIVNLGIFRYRVNQGSTGKGYFIKPFAAKANDEFLDGHLFDSRILETQIDKVIRDAIKPLLSQSQSVFSTAPATTGYCAPSYPLETPSTLTQQYAQIEVQPGLPF
jgi:hypothetical protein